MTANSIFSSWVFVCALAAAAEAQQVLTPYRYTETHAETEYPTFPFPAFPDLPVYVTASDGDVSNLGAHLSTSSRSPLDQMTYSMAEAHATFGKVRARAEGIRSADGRTKGSATASSWFGDGFAIDGGPENGIARMAVRFEGLLEQRAGGTPSAHLSVSVWENFEGGQRLFRSTIFRNQVQSEALTEGVTIIPVSATDENGRIDKTVVISFPYQAARNYFLAMALETDVQRAGLADFFNSGSISAFTAEQGASFSFASGTPADAYGVVVPEPALTGLIFALGSVRLLARSRTALGDHHSDR